MAFFISLTGAHSKEEVLVNIDEIRFISRFIGGGAQSAIHFDNEHSLPVKENPREVMAKCDQERKAGLLVA